MINKVGRDIPQEILDLTGKEVFQGAYAKQGVEYKTATHTVAPVMDPSYSKVVNSIEEVLKKCGIKDGMTLGFHHHFREGDMVVNMVMKAVHDMGIKDITIAPAPWAKPMILSFPTLKMAPSPTFSLPACAAKSAKQSATAN